MKKYKIVILVVLMSTLLAGAAFSQDGGDIKVSLLTNVNYQFDLSNHSQYTSLFATEIAEIGHNNTSVLDGLSGLNFGLGFQMLFALSDALALGFEVGIESPIASLIAASETYDLTLFSMQVLPRIVFTVGYGDLLSLDFLAGIRLGLDFFSSLHLHEDFIFRFTTDVEARVNLSFSQHFALYVGVNYILPFEAVLENENLLFYDTSNPLSVSAGVLSPSIGVRFSF